MLIFTGIFYFGAVYLQGRQLGGKFHSSPTFSGIIFTFTKLCEAMNMTNNAQGRPTTEKMSCQGLGNKTQTTKIINFIP